MRASVVLVRPWTDSRGGSGCCSGEARDGICFDGPLDGSHEHDAEVDLVASAYRRLRAELPGVDVQIVSANNTAFLLPFVFRAVRRRHGTRAALRRLNKATTPGSLLLDGEYLGDIRTLGPEGVVSVVRHKHTPLAPHP